MYLSIYLSVCQTCQGDGKAEIEWREPSISNLPGRREHAACRPKMPAKKGRATNGVSHVYQTCQADVKTCHLKAKNAHLKKHTRETSAIYHVCQNLASYLSISMYLSIYLSIKPARATAKLKLNGVSQVSQTCQADVNMQPAGQKCQLKKGRATNGVSHVYQTC